MDLKMASLDYLNDMVCFWWWLFFHDPVGCRISPPDATLNFHPIANAVSEWDANGQN